MFTGIVDHCGVLLLIRQLQNNLRLTFSCQFENLQAGESIAVNGVCLTVVDPQEGQFSVEVSPETFRLTNLGLLSVDDDVNLERALRLSDRIGGHIVTGHVDQTVGLVQRHQCDDFVELSFASISDDAAQFFIHKGSVAINGVSLTINKITDDQFSVMLIPHTLQLTNLVNLKIDQKVNIEYDWLIKVFARQREVRGNV